MKSDFLIALTQLAAERNLPREIVLSAIEAALVSAYRKDTLATGQNISVKLDPGSGEVLVYLLKTVVEKVEDPQLEISLKDAKKIKADAAVGDSVPTGELPHSAGRIAAQTAKQVVLQRLREAERELVYEEYTDKEGEVFTVTIQRMEPKQIIVELGRAEAILPISEQVYAERYRVGQKVKVLLQSIQKSTKGPELIVSRADKLLLKRLFEMEVPEIFNGAVEIKAIAREPGARSKVAVWAKQEGVDPVGSCVGLRGIRIQNIVNELHGEKIDVVAWDKELPIFIAHALSPAQVLRVDLNSDTGTATAVVPDRQLSLAIGKEGQNARLAAKLTGWKVDIKSDVDAAAAPPEVKPKPAVAAAEAAAAKQAEPVVAVAAEAAPKTEEPVAAAGVVQAAASLAPAAPAGEQAVGAAAGPGEPGAGAKDLDAEILELLEQGEEPAAEEAPAEESASLSDLPEEVWSVRRATVPADSGQIRFAEDIEELRGGGARRGGKRTDSNKPARRKTKTGKWR
ncbi:MAG: transcription termination/antitermination protein NusA [SAR202 cluster bacterium]|nr:transcription termination/antitermination protein NusA [SAR202 cluster bacterium]